MPRGENVSHPHLEIPTTENSVLVHSQCPIVQRLAKNAVPWTGDTRSSQSLEKPVGFPFSFLEISLAGNSMSCEEGREGRQSGHTAVLGLSAWVHCCHRLENTPDTMLMAHPQLLSRV